jgi:intracellular sulfur oxidation DsrE/DsrF family protein
MTFLFLTSDQMGSGPDPALGRKLLATFLEKLAASDTSIDVVGCVNGAVFLTTEGSTVLASLRALEAKGARVASCKTCLTHFGLEDKVRVGVVGTMDQTVEVLGKADKIIRPT